MKSKEELNTLKKEVETVSRKLYELTEEEIEQITGGVKYVIIGHGQRRPNLGENEL